MWELVYNELKDAGPVVGILAVVVLVGAVRAWWVWGWVYKAMVKEMEYWRGKAFDLAGLGEEVAEVATELLEEAS